MNQRHDAGSPSSANSDVRSALKWPGGKRRVIEHIRAAIPKQPYTRLVEPFVGGGSVFLNLAFEQYLLCDTNRDLISLYRAIKRAPKKFHRLTQALFTPETNTPAQYYALREQFNQSTDPDTRAVLFLYLNRHGFNGLCRYNRSGGYNVPFGRYKKPYFPAQEIENLRQRLQYATLFQGDFEKAFNRTKAGDLVYCDPPYVPLNQTANFTAYAGNDFSLDDQVRLVRRAQDARTRGITTIISNHYTPFTQTLYSGANQQFVFPVQRSISQIGTKREKVQEVIAVYTP